MSTRAITLSVQMRKGEQIGEFGKLVDATNGTSETAAAR